jgi:23S rRNA pseudouridine1911/1915/1917 synthase
MFRNGDIHKTYWAVVQSKPEEEEDTLEHWLVRNEEKNKTYVYYHEVPHSKKAILKYRLIGQSEHYYLLEVILLTGRHHQIRSQLAAIDCPIKGDLKYGAKRSNPDGSISLLARRLDFIHPVSKEHIVIDSPLPQDNLWQNIIFSDK